MKLKLKRNSIIPLIIITIVCLVFLPVLAYYLKYKNTENFVSSYKPPSYVDRILFSSNMYDRGYTDSLGTELDLSGQYSYCLGGTIKCTGDSSSKLTTVVDNYKYGTTYQAKCSDGTTPSCLNNYYSELTDASMINHKNEVDPIFKSTGINVMDKDKLWGFVGPYNYTSFVRDPSMNEILTYYLDADLVKSSPNKSFCDLVQKKDQSDCNSYYYNLKNNTVNNGYNATVSGDDDTTGDSSKGDEDLDGYDSKEGNYSSLDGSCDDKIPCIADFATNVGDALCCGQTGVLQNTKYVCPANAPKCSNFKCGSKFGTCSA